MPEWHCALWILPHALASNPVLSPGKGTVECTDSSRTVRVKLFNFSGFLSKISAFCLIFKILFHSNIENWKVFKLLIVEEH